MKFETLGKQRWYDRNPSTITFKCTEIFTRGFPMKLKDFANINAELNNFQVHLSLQFFPFTRQYGRYYT